MDQRSKTLSEDSNDQPAPPSHSLHISILICITLLVFGNLIRADFCLLDDPFNISQNPNLNPPSFASFIGYWTTQSVYGLYIPLTYTVWGILAMIAYVPTPDAWGAHLNPYVFHAANILLHVGSALAAYALLNQLFQNRFAALLGAILFSVHPVQVESVAWAAGLKDVLSGMLSLIALWQYATFARLRSAHPSRHFNFGTVALILAMLAKPSAMMTPVIALALDWLIIGRKPRLILFALFPWFILAFACAINARIAQGTFNVDAGPLWARPLIVGDSLAFYLRKIFLPIHLAVDYEHKPSIVLQTHAIYFLWIIPAMLGTIFFLLRNRIPSMLAGGAVLLIATAPVLGAVPFLYQQFSTTADHYLYLAMLGPAIWIACLSSHCTGRVVKIIILLTLAVLSARSALQTRVWLDDISLFSNSLTVAPNSILSMNNLGHAYLREKRFAEAKPLFERVLQIDPENYQALENSAALLRMQSDPNSAIELRKRAFDIMQKRPPEVRQDLADLRNSIGLDLLDAGRFAEAEDWFAEAIKLRPDYVEAQRNLQLAEEKLRAATTGPASRSQ